MIELILILSAQFIFNIFIIYKLYELEITRFFVKYRFNPRPINPNTVERPCQFCGALPAQKGIDGFWVCGVCKVRKMNRAR